MTFGSLLHVRRRALGDLLAVVEHQHAVADAHHQLHVVLDQQDRDAVVADASISLPSATRLGGVHAGRRLVEREQLRLGGERARDLQPALVAVGQAAGGIVGARGGCRRSRAAPARAARSRFSSAQRALVAQDRAASRRRACARGGRSSRSRAPTGWRTGGCSGTCARCRRAATWCGFRPASAAPVEGERARVGRVDAGEHVEQRGLAGAVRADQAVDLALRGS